MTYELTEVGLVYILAATLTAMAAPFAWTRRRRSPGAMWLFLMLAAGVEWTLADAMENSVLGMGGHLFWAKISYLGGASIVVFLFLFALEYTGKGRWVRKISIYPLFVLPVLVALAAFTNERHGLIWTSISAGDPHTYVYSHGPLYWLITAYSFALVGATTLILLDFAFRNRRLFRNQAIAIASAIAVPWAAVIIYDLRPDLLPGFDPSVTLAFSGVILTAAMLRFRLFDLLPVARTALIEKMPDGLLVIDGQGRIVDCNPSAGNLFGWPSSEAIGRPVSDALSKWPQLAGRLAGVGGQQEEFSMEISEHKCISLLVSPLWDRAGQVSGSLAIIRDITALQETQDALRQAANDLRQANKELQIEVQKRHRAEELERRQKTNFEALLNAQSELGHGLTVVERQSGRIHFANEAFCRMSGYEQNDLFKISFFTMVSDAPQDYLIVPGSTDEKLEPLATRQARSSGPENHETRLTRSDGSIVEIEMGARELDSDYGKHLIVVTRDIGERKAAEEALRTSEERYRSLFEESKDAVCTFTEDARILQINPAGVELFGYGSAEEMALIDPDRDLFSDPSDRHRLLAELSSQRFVKDFELRLKTRGGGHVIVYLTANTVLDHAGKITSVRGIMHDVTGHRSLEQQLIQAQKMESVGRLAGGVAHDLNNFLTAIMGYIDLATREVQSEGRVWEELRGARKATDHAADLTRQLLLFSRRELPELKPVDLNRTVEGLSKMLARVIGENYPIVRHLCEDAGTVSADPGHLEQVLMNLVVNARDSMAGGGTIFIRTGKRTLSEPGAGGAAAAGEYCCLSVQDSGTGMDPETMSQIFEPFYTTKGAGKGTGLGLSVVFGIVAQHGGWIDVESKEGNGSKFSIYLPLIAKEPEPVSEEESTLERYQGRGEKILVVEDSDILRELAHRMLSDNGYEVVTAADALAAEAMFVNNGHDIRLVFSDVVLPGEDGISLVSRLLPGRPGLKVLLASGYSNEEQSQAIRESDFRFIPKPYVLPELLMTLRELMH